ncbi:MAG: hypothetical protein AAF914_11275 [Pseudomonadota bacterium]
MTIKTAATFALAAIMALAGLSAAPANAQATGASREGPTGLSGAQRRFPTVFGAASAFPSPGGTGFVGLNYVNPRGGLQGEGPDGDAGAGYTIGNPIQNVSLTFGLTITSLEGFGDSGSLSLSGARALVVGDRSLTFIGASAANLAGWGDAEDTPEAYSLYVSHLLAVPAPGGEVPVQLTAGYGNRITLSEDGLGAVDDGLFAGVGVGIGPNLSAGVSATETQINAGVSFGLPDLPGVSVSAGVFDVTDNVERRQFSLSVSYGF